MAIVGSKLIQKRVWSLGALVLLIAVALIAVFFNWGLAGDENTVEAQAGSPIMYTVKFLCVPAVGPRGQALLSRNYKTVVNIHNPGDDVQFQKKAVIARSQRDPRGRISPIKTDFLKPDEALGVDCKDIRTLFGAGMPIGDGFLVILSPVELDVVAVYTSNHLTASGAGHSIDVEYIQPRRLP